MDRRPRVDRKIPSSVQIDSFQFAAHPDSVPKLLRLLMCWAMLVGLVGNGVALAAPCVLMPAEQAAPAMAMGSDCDAMMADDTPAPQKTKASGCLAMAACAAVLTLPDSGSADTSCGSGAGEFPARVTALAGRNLAPEPEPPTQSS
jgi:hypothetical protein